MEGVNGYLFSADRRYLFNKLLTIASS